MSTPRDEWKEHVRALLAAPAVRLKNFPSMGLFTIHQLIENNRAQVLPAGHDPDDLSDIMIVHLDSLAPAPALAPVEPGPTDQEIANRAKEIREEQSATRYVEAMTHRANQIRKALGDSGSNVATREFIAALMISDAVDRVESRLDRIEDALIDIARKMADQGDHP